MTASHSQLTSKNAEGQIDGRYKNNIGPQVRRRRYALGRSQSVLATKLQIAGFNTSRSGSKIEAHRSYVDDKNTSVFRGSAKSTGTGTLSGSTAWQSNPQFLRET
jgi:hypothetical protein